MHLHICWGSYLPSFNPRLSALGGLWEDYNEIPKKIFYFVVAQLIGQFFRTTNFKVCLLFRSAICGALHRLDLGQNV